MFEQVRKPAAPRRLETESDLVVATHGNHCRRGVRCDHHVQAICQFGAFNPNLESIQAQPPVTFAFEFFAQKSFSNSANIPAASCESTRAARRLSTAYARANSSGDSRSASKCARTTLKSPRESGPVHAARAPSRSKLSRTWRVKVNNARTASLRFIPSETSNYVAASSTAST